MIPSTMVMPVPMSRDQTPHENGQVLRILPKILDICCYPTLGPLVFSQASSLKKMTFSLPVTHAA
jgi:hypothetical protein